MSKTKAILIKISIIFNVVTLLALFSLLVIYQDLLYEKLWLRNHATIVMLGDSHTEAVDWRELMNRGDIKNSGLPGLTTSQFVWVLHDKVIRYKPKICYIEGGGNDLGAGIPTTRILQNISDIIDTLQRHEVKPVLQSVIITPNAAKNVQIDSLNVLYQEIALKKGIEFLDINNHLRQSGRREYLSDQVHLKPSAHTPWANIIKSNLAKNRI